MSFDFKIPDKLTFKRLEVVKLTRLDGKVIDFWEKEFGGFAPVANVSGEKFYSRKDVETILKIKQLLIVEKKDKAHIRRLVGKDDRDTLREEDFKFMEKTGGADNLQIIKSKLIEILTLLDKNDKY